MITSFLRRSSLIAIVLLCAGVSFGAVSCKKEQKKCNLSKGFATYLKEKGTDFGVGACMKQRGGDAFVSTVNELADDPGGSDDKCVANLKPVCEVVAKHQSACDPSGELAGWYKDRCK